MCSAHEGGSEVEPRPRVTRRQVLKGAGLGLGSLAISGALTGPAAAALKKALAPGQVLKLALVKPKNAQQAAALARFDDTHAIVNGVREFLLWPGDEARLRELGIQFEITVKDLLARDRRIAAQKPSTLVTEAPPGFTPRTTYRRLQDYEVELHALPEKYPTLARTIQLPTKTLEGRNVYGIEIGADVNATDGRPIAYFDGVHHAREWPASEYCMIFAHHLLQNYGTDQRLTSLLDRCRVTIIPIMNVDGFHYTRENPLEVQDLGIVAGGQGAYWRKNRRSYTGVTAPYLNNNPDAYGVDPNRNYPFKWGATTGGGAGVTPLTGPVPAYASTSPNPYDQTYYGLAPLSEPETQNVSGYLLGHNVTAMITNHTYGRLVLRPWGDTTTASFDEALMKQLGDAMAHPSVLGYTSQIGLSLYPTTGTTDDWFYAATSGIGYTFEHGSGQFHPTYTTTNAPGGFWPKVMEAFTMLAEAAADPAKHSVITGRVTDAAGNPISARLTIHKEFDTPMWPQGAAGIGPLAHLDPDVTHEILHLVTQAREDGTFEWHVNPSTRPLVAKPPTGPPGIETYALTISAEGLGSWNQDIDVVRGEIKPLGDIVLA